MQRYHIGWIFLIGNALFWIWLASAVLCQIVPLSTMIVSNDKGGDLSTRFKVVEQLKASHRPVRIEGECLSACTLLLALDNICIKPSARLGFHGPQSSLWGIGLPPKEFEYWSRRMGNAYGKYPAIKRWFMAEARNVTVGIYYVSGKTMIKQGMKDCGRG